MDKNSLVSAHRLHTVIVSKPGFDVEFLAFAPGGRPAVFWTRFLAEGWLEELRRQRVIADGRVEWRVKRAEARIS